MWKKILTLVIGILFGFWLIDDFDPDILKGKNVAITGASTGIGEQMAYHYAKMGANVLITSRREAVLKKVITRCKELGSKAGKYAYIAADLGNLFSTSDVIQEALSKLGGIDILVLNHIIPIPLGMWVGNRKNLTLADTVMDINLKSYIHLASHALPHLKATNGSIIVVSSFAGKVGQAFNAIYSSTKFALDGFFGSLRQEFTLKKTDVSITLCVIGLIGTESAMKNLKDYKQDFLLSYLPAEKPSDAGLAIIKGGAKRQREIYFPYLSIRMMVLFRDLFPNAVEGLNRLFNSCNSC